jgi:diguanylate cyclase (GGDEF)-like protein
MDDLEKSKEQLLAELRDLRARVAELEHAEADRRRADGRFHWDASHDELTGLFDRAHFLERLTPIVRSGQRYKYPVSLCMCSLDSLESLREAKGRQVADELIGEFAELVMDELRGEDIAGRYDENQFCVVFPHTMAVDAATAVARVCKRLEKMVSGLPITATFGIAQLAPEDMADRQLVALAERTLRRAREAGGARVLIHEP